MIWLVVALAGLLLAALGWGVFEAGWVRLEELDTPIPGLPEELDGLRVCHIGDFHLGFPSRGHNAVSKAVDWICERKPDLVLVFGDTNATLAGAITAAKLKIPLAHVEAGLRSYTAMPEEINRIITDSIADLLFVSERSGLTNLRNEGIPDSKVFFVGNVMIDSLVHFKEKAARSTIRKALGVEGKQYAIVTLHRPSNVDVRDNLASILSMLDKISQRQTVIFPVHPRTRKMISEFKLSERLLSNTNLILCDPLGYLEFLCLLESASLAITDSGGIQEETTYLGIPCFTMRENTERPVTVSEGTNTLMGFDYEKTAVEAETVFQGNYKKGKIPELWDGKTAERIAEIIYENISKN